MAEKEQLPGEYEVETFIMGGISPSEFARIAEEKGEKREHLLAQRETLAAAFLSDEEDDGNFSDDFENPTSRTRGKPRSEKSTSSKLAELVIAMQTEHFKNVETTTKAFAPNCNEQDNDNGNDENGNTVNDAIEKSNTSNGKE